MEPIEIHVQKECQAMVNHLNFLAVAALGGNWELVQKIINSVLADLEFLRVKMINDGVIREESDPFFKGETND